MRKAIFIASIMATIAAGTVQPTMAAPGDLDPSFGDGGIVIDARGPGRAVAIQPDGKIVAVSSSSFTVVRFLSDGRLDKSFGGIGFVTTDLGTGDESAEAVAIQSDGKLVVAGSRENAGNFDIAVVRYNTDGSPDANFDGDGIVTTAIGAGSETALAVRIQGDGKIVVGGEADMGGDSDFAMVRYDDDGSLDPSFDGDGIVTTPIGAVNDSGQALAIQPDGAIVLAGYTGTGTNYSFAVARFDSSGSLDPTFDGDGIVTTDLRVGVDRANDVALQANGKIVVVGSTSDGVDSDIALVRYQADGSLDPAFGGDGIVTTDLDNAANQVEAVAIQDDGRIVAAGSTRVGTFPPPVPLPIFAIAVLRYDPDGSLDTTFDGDGVVVTSAGSFYADGAFAVTLQGDGKIVVCGEDSPAIDDTLVVARYSVTNCGDGVLDNGEDCDDGNLVPGDGCNAGCNVETDCAALPLPEGSCFAATRHQLQIVDPGTPGKERVRWKWQTDGDIYQVDLGAPDADTKYTLCVYDTMGGVPSLATRLDLALGWPPWVPNSPKGWSYNDKSGNTDGVQKFRIKTSFVGQASARLTAKGANVPLSFPASPTRYFDQDPNVIVQLVNSDGLCLTGAFTSAKENDGTRFKATSP